MIDKAKTRHRIFQVLAMSWFLLITYMFLMPKNNVPRLHFDLGIPLDKAVHGGGFFITALLCLLAIPHTRRTTQITLFIILLVYAILIEVLQKSMNLGRSFEWSDIIFDMMGAFAGFGAYKLVTNIVYKE